MNSLQNSPPRIGFMLGDVTGIGPEIAAKLLASGKAGAGAQVVICGDRRVLELGMRDAGVNFKWKPYPRIEDVSWPREDVPVVDLGNIDPAQFERGVANAESGRLTGESREGQVLRLLQTGEKSSRDLAEVMGLGKQSILNYLNRLRERGLVEPTTERLRSPSTQWRLRPPPKIDSNQPQLFE